MKKRIIPILMIMYPYLWLLLVVFMPRSDGNGEIYRIFYWSIVIVFIANIIYPFIMIKNRERSSVILFWDILPKLLNIPIYIMFFFIATVFMILPLGFMIALTIAVFDYIILIPSSMYGVIGLIQAKREGKISKTSMIINIIFHFCFCLDVISAVVMYIKLRKKKNSTLYKQNLYNV